VEGARCRQPRGELVKRRRRPDRRADFAFVADDEMVSLAAEVLAEATIQDDLERDGHSLGMGGVDEVGEAVEAGRSRSVERGSSTRLELVRGAAVALRALRSIDVAARREPAPSSGPGRSKPSAAASAPQVCPQPGEDRSGRPLREPFWNLTEGRRPAEPVPWLFAEICVSEGSHIYDGVYGPDECARCGSGSGRCLSGHGGGS
jgi:hypothetical protein